MSEDAEIQKAWEDYLDRTWESEDEQGFKAGYRSRDAEVENLKARLERKGGIQIAACKECEHFLIIESLEAKLASMEKVVEAARKLTTDECKATLIQRDGKPSIGDKLKRLFYALRALEEKKP